MQSVLISIKPKWCELIASGKKTIDVRKTKPKLNTPFKCYIYCTKGNIDICPKNIWWRADDTGFQHIMNGKVIGEFVCDKCTNIFALSRFWLDEEVVEKSCLTLNQIRDYSNGSNKLYGWHILDLQIYEQTKELKEFVNDCCDYFDTSIKDCTCFEFCCYQYREITFDGQEIIMCANPEMCIKRITRPPQSWCYVESLRKEN